MWRWKNFDAKSNFDVCSRRPLKSLCHLHRVDIERRRMPSEIFLSSIYKNTDRLIMRKFIQEIYFFLFQNKKWTWRWKCQCITYSRIDHWRFCFCWRSRHKKQGRRDELPSLKGMSLNYLTGGSATTGPCAPFYIYQPTCGCVFKLGSELWVERL